MYLPFWRSWRHPPRCRPRRWPPLSGDGPSPPGLEEEETLHHRESLTASWTSDGPWSACILPVERGSEWYVRLNIHLKTSRGLWHLDFHFHRTGHTKTCAELKQWTLRGWNYHYKSRLQIIKSKEWNLLWAQKADTTALRFHWQSERETVKDSRMNEREEQ